MRLTIFLSLPEALYKDEGKHTYGMYDPDDKRIGDCEITDDRDSLTCAHAIFGIESSTLYWSCMLKPLFQMPQCMESLTQGCRRYRLHHS